MNRLYKIIRYDWPLHFVLLFTGWLPDNVFFIRMRGILARPFFKKAGKNLKLGRDITFYDPSNITIGSNVYVAKGCWFNCQYGIEIGSDILFGPYVSVVTSNHSLKNGAYAFGENVRLERVIIKDGAWIATHATLLPGTIINKAVLVAANAVIQGETEEYGIYGGIPARLLKKAVEQAEVGKGVA
ncbi:MAG TPA: acyltransferase [Bacteroidia bacterium]|nr:acyltransferase [Bacteroidia bacterium]